MRDSEIYKDIWRLVGMIAVLGVLVFVFIIRPQIPPSPIRGRSADEVLDISKARTRDTALAALKSLPDDYRTCTTEQIARRWKSLETQSNSWKRGTAIEQARKKFLARTWPVHVQRASINDKVCWVVVGWHLMNIGFCGNSQLSQNQAEDIVVDACTEIAIVEDDAPHQVLAYILGDPRIGAE